VDVHVLERTARVVAHLQLASGTKEPVSRSDIHLIYPPGLEEHEVEREDRGPGELVLRYDLTPAAGDDTAGRRLRVLIPWPKAAATRKAQVRVWASGGTSVELDEGDAAAPGWKDRELEEDAARGFFPSLSLVHAGPAPDLALLLRQERSLQMRVEKSLIHVRVDGKGNQEYHARFLVRAIHARDIRVQLPLAPAACLERLTLKDVEAPRAADDKAWDVLRLKLEPAHFAQPVVLEIVYRVPVGAQESKWGLGTTFTPPRWLGDVDLGQVRWQISLPSSAFAVPVGTRLRADYAWGLIGWLIGPVPSESNAELEAWLTGSPVGAAAVTAPPVSLILEQPALEPILILNGPRPVWLLVCSTVVLVLGLGLLLLRVPRGFLYLLVFALAVGLVALAWFWPTLLPAILYGCQPGLVALAVLILTHWLLQQSYRRQMVFLPGFTRLKQGSSLTRARAPKERDASTVDAPAPSGIAPSGIGKASTSQSPKTA
jgi:hypothetical protein